MPYSWLAVSHEMLHAAMEGVGVICTDSKTCLPSYLSMASVLSMQAQLLVALSCYLPGTYLDT